MLRSALATLIVVLSIALMATNPLHAQGGIAVGTLKCNVGGGVGFIIGSSKDLKCVYLPNDRMPVHWYRGRVEEFGIDIGFTQHGVIIWAVVAPTSSLRAGALQGTYVGGSASVTAGLGLGANALVGGGNSIALQPISIEGSQGLNVAAGIAKINLQHVVR
jgi:hypothetical protein